MKDKIPNPIIDNHPYERLWKRLGIESRKLERIINDPKRGFHSLSKDQVNFHQKLWGLIDELKFQMSSHWLSEIEENKTS